MDYEPGQQIGPYTVIERLGTGGMSNVYRAHDAEHDRDVVLKFPHEEIMEDIATHERFTREVKIGKLLHHPHIQQLYELARFGPSEYLVLEYVPGQSMRRFLRDRHRAPEDFALATTHGPPDRAGAGLHARTPRRAPRPQAGEHHRHARRPGESDGLRHRLPEGRAPRHLGAALVPGRHARLHGPGADPGRARRRPHRHLRAGHDPVRAASPAACPTAATTPWP